MQQHDAEKLLNALKALYAVRSFKEMFVSAVQKLPREEVDKLNELITTRVEELEELREAIQLIRDSRK